MIIHITYLLLRSSFSLYSWNCCLSGELRGDGRAHITHSHYLGQLMKSISCPEPSTKLLLNIFFRKWQVVTETGTERGLAPCARGSGGGRGSGTFSPSGGHRGETGTSWVVTSWTIYWWVILSFTVRTETETFSEENCQLEIDFFAADEERQVLTTAREFKVDILFK